jgi:DNA-binding response OmpR family regulator
MIITGRAILIIEDEPVIALDIKHAFEDAGAKAISVRTLAAALLAVEAPIFRPPSLITRSETAIVLNLPAPERA